MDTTWTFGRWEMLFQQNRHSQIDWRFRILSISPKYTGNLSGSMNHSLPFLVIHAVLLLAINPLHCCFIWQEDAISSIPHSLLGLFGKRNLVYLCFVATRRGQNLVLSFFRGYQTWPSLGDLGGGLTLTFGLHTIIFKSCLFIERSCKLRFRQLLHKFTFTIGTIVSRTISHTKVLHDSRHFFSWCSQGVHFFCSFVETTVCLILTFILAVFLALVTECYFTSRCYLLV